MDQKNVFLSHSSKDDEIVGVAISILQGQGGAVYVDNGEERLPRIPSQVRWTLFSVLTMGSTLKVCIWAVVGTKKQCVAKPVSE